MYISSDDILMVYKNVMEVYRNSGIETLVRGDLEAAIDHGILVTKTVRMLCDSLELTEEFKQDVLVAAGVHDVGKLLLSNVLYGRDKNSLHVAEVRYMRMHSANGRRLLLACGYSESILDAVYHHHENFDGSGYPDHLAGTQIPLSARIIKVCDTFCALVSERPYRAAFEFDTAIEMMIEDSKDYDMGLLLEFMKIYNSKEFEDIKKYARFANKKRNYSIGA